MIELKVKTKQLQAKTKNQAKENAQRMSVLQKENEKMRNLHGVLDSRNMKRTLRKGRNGLFKRRGKVKRTNQILKKENKRLFWKGKTVMVCTKNEILQQKI